MPGSIPPESNSLHIHPGCRSLRYLDFFGLERCLELVSLGLCYTYEDDAVVHVCSFHVINPFRVLLSFTQACIPPMATGVMYLTDTNHELIV